MRDYATDISFVIKTASGAAPKRKSSPALERKNDVSVHRYTPLPNLFFGVNVKTIEPDFTSVPDATAVQAPVQPPQAVNPPTKKPRKKGALPSAFKYRGRWRIQVPVGDGKREVRDFDKRADAIQWAREVLLIPSEPKAKAPRQPKRVKPPHDPGEYGGPEKATLADALLAYARLCTVSKKGALAEVGRINRYLNGVGRPLLRLSLNEVGRYVLETVAPKVQKRSLAVVNEVRRQRRKQTYAHFARLAGMVCADITPSHIREFKVCMEAEGLSDSTIQKEIAMLKVVFNTAETEWGWSDFRNPCSTIKLGKSKERFVHLDEDEEAALYAAIDECDNPYMAPLVFIARETTLRRGTLLSAKWADIDLKNRCMLLNTKTGQRKYVFTALVQEVLQQLKGARDSMSSDRVFPLSGNALTCAWNRLRARAGLHHLHFKDLRHLGATEWVRRGLGAYQLKAVLGHSSIATAQYYVDLVGEDQRDAIDTAMEKVSNLSLPRVAEDAQKSRNLRQAARLNKRHQPPACEDVGTPESQDIRADAQPHATAPPVCASTRAKQISPIAVLPCTSGLVNFSFGNALSTSYQYSLKTLPSQLRH